MPPDTNRQQSVVSVRDAYVNKLRRATTHVQGLDSRANSCCCCVLSTTCICVSVVVNVLRPAGNNKAGVEVHVYANGVSGVAVAMLSAIKSSVSVLSVLTVSCCAAGSEVGTAPALVSSSAKAGASSPETTVVATVAELCNTPHGHAHVRCGLCSHRDFNQPLFGTQSSYLQC